MRATHTTKTDYPTLRAWRTAKGWTQQEAADFLKVSLVKYTRWERRARFAKGPEAKTVTRKTRVPVLVLVGAA